MKYFTLLLFIAFISINIFGFMIFNYGMNHIEGGCIASLVDGVDCPQNIIDFAIHKITAIKTFSTTLISSDFVLPIVFSILTFSFLLLLFYKEVIYFKIRFLSQRWRELLANFYNNKLKFIKWYSLLENSPTI